MIISRAEKHSPHSSPRLSRRSTTPNVIPSAAAVPTPSSVAAPSDIYAAQQAILPTAPSMHSINGGNQPANCNVMKSTTKPPATNQSASSSNRMSAPPMSSSSTQVINKVLNKALSADLNDIHANDQIAPPLPPRKSTPSVDSSVNRQLKPLSINNVTSASSLVNLSTNTTISSALSRSSENITFCEFDVPNSIAPPIPKHNVPRPVVQTVASDLQVLSTTDDDDDIDKVIVGPAETITGLIDTRPLDARKPIIISTTDKEQSTNNESNNLYHMKTNSNQPNPQRNQSVPNSNTTSSSITTNITTTTSTPSMVNAITSRPMSTKSQAGAETSCSSGSGGMMAPSDATQPLLYENVTINHKDCNVPYENINLEYIARLMNEGYSKESVVTALGISRNNIEMACDILHEFVSKNSA